MATLELNDGLSKPNAGANAEADANAAAQLARERSLNDNPFNTAPLGLVREIAMLLAVCSGQGMVLAALSQAVLPEAVIGKSFGVEQINGPWGAAAYALTSAGRIGDMYGHRKCFIIAYASLGMTSLITGLSVYSNSFIFYAVCRALMGIAAAMLVPCALAVLGYVYKEGPRKNIAFSCYAAGSPIGFTLGSVFSALIAQLSWWPWMNYIMAMACITMAGIGFLAIPHLPPGGSLEFDWLGSVTGVSGLVLFNFAWNRAPAAGWQSAECISTLVIGTALFLAFVITEKRVSAPLVPIDRISKSAIYVLVAMALAWASFGIMIYYMYTFTTQLRGDSLLSTAAQTLPVPVAGCTASYLNTWLLGRGVQASKILAFSLVWFIISSIILATLPVNQLYWKQAFWFYVLAPFGMDLSFPSASLVMSALVPREQQGMAASLIATVVFYSQSLGLGIAGTVQAQVAKGNVLRGYRGAFYSGIGMPTLGLLVALVPVIEDIRRKNK